MNESEKADAALELVSRLAVLSTRVRSGSAVDGAAAYGELDSRGLLSDIEAMAERHKGFVAEFAELHQEPVQCGRSVAASWHAALAGICSGVALAGRGGCEEIRTLIAESGSESVHAMLSTAMDCISGRSGKPPGRGRARSTPRPPEAAALQVAQERMLVLAEFAKIISSVLEDFTLHAPRMRAGLQQEHGREGVEDRIATRTAAMLAAQLAQPGTARPAANRKGAADVLRKLLEGEERGRAWLTLANLSPPAMGKENPNERTRNVTRQLLAAALIDRPAKGRFALTALGRATAQEQRRHRQETAPTTRHLTAGK